MQPLPALPVIPAVGNPCRDHGCSQCCHDTEMLLTNDDIARITAVRSDVEFYFQAEDGFLQLRTRDGDTALGGPPGAKPCTFLHPDGHCTIHAVRPEGCRLYPAVWDSDLRRPVLDEEECPHTESFGLDADAMDAVARLAAALIHERNERVRGRLPRVKFALRDGDA